MPVSLPRLLCLLCAAASTGCAANAPNGRVEEREADDAVLLVRSQGMQDRERHAPIQSRLDAAGAPQVGGRVQLLATVQRHVDPGRSVSLKLVLPDGVALVEGTAKQTVQLGDTGAPQQRTFVLRVDEWPDRDAVLHVDAEGPGYGYHAEHPYRFGREAPVPEAPTRAGPELRKGTRSLGRTIPLR